VVLAASDALRFRDPNRPHFDQRDLDIALGVDRFDRAIQVTLADGRRPSNAACQVDAQW
jgi:hypothetical protein